MPATRKSDASHQETNLSERSYQFLREQLSNGKLRPGDQLVNRTLAKEIGVSIVPVREAINRLSSEGLVERVPGAGAFVRKLDAQDLDNLYVLRDALESCAAAEAARYINELELEELYDILKEAQTIADKLANQSRGHATKAQMEAWLSTEKRFHSLLIEAARNPLLARVAGEHHAISQIFDSQRTVPELLTAKVASLTCSGKKSLLAALKRRDHAKARELMSAQIQRGRKRVLQLYRKAQ